MSFSIGRHDSNNEDYVFRKGLKTAARTSSLASTSIKVSAYEETVTRQTRWFKLSYHDPNIEKTYLELFWSQRRLASQQFYTLMLVLSFFSVEVDEQGRLQFPLLFLGGLSCCLLFATLAWTSNDPLLKYATKSLPVLCSLLCVLEAFQERPSNLSLDWLILPLIVAFQGYFSPCIFEEIILERILFVAISFLISLIKFKFNLGFLISFVASNFLVLKHIYDQEKRDRDTYLERQLHIRNLNTQYEQQIEKTLVRNALKLTFPENPFHDASTETRIEKIAQELEMPLYDAASSEGLVLNLSTPVPRYYQFLMKIKSVKIACYKHHGDPVIVHSINSLDTLETDEDLKKFMKSIRDASNLSEIPGLLHTVGYCMTPCTFVIEDYIDDPLVTLKDLALELGAEDLTLDWCFFKPLAACLARTLSIMHRNAVVHRHISLNTILLTGKETCVLLPTSFYETLPEVRRKLWGVQGVWDVPAEAKDSPSSYTEASDVWQLCVVCWEMLVGPFHFQVTPFAMPITVPKAIVNLIMDGLSPDPEGRPTMDELYQHFSQKESDLRDSVVASAAGFERVLQRLDASGELKSKNTVKFAQ